MERPSSPHTHWLIHHGAQHTAHSPLHGCRSHSLPAINESTAGEAKIGWIHKNDLVERQLKPGDVLRIPAGSTFYFVNTRKDHQLQIISSIEPVDPDLIGDLFTPFFIGGGEYPPSVFTGFDISTLTSSFNATPEEVGVLTSARFAGSIIFITGKEANQLHQFTGDMKSAVEKLKQNRRLARDDEEKIQIEEKRKEACSWTSILSSIFFGEAATQKNVAQSKVRDPVEAPDAYNIYDHDPDFKNDYGWSIEVNEHDYLPLKQSDISVFLVNLSAGSMMAPHVNPRATEYGVVIAGAGTVEVLHPNGTAAMKAKVSQGDVFWVPRFYPFCQVAAREGSLEILDRKSVV